MVFEWATQHCMRPTYLTRRVQQQLSQGMLLSMDFHYDVYTWSSLPFPGISPCEWARVR